MKLVYEIFVKLCQQISKIDIWMPVFSCKQNRSILNKGCILFGTREVQKTRKKRPVCVNCIDNSTPTKRIHNATYGFDSFAVHFVMLVRTCEVKTRISFLVDKQIGEIDLSRKLMEFEA